MGSLLNNILDWMQINNLRLCSFERIVASVPGASTFEEITAEIRANPSIFRTANIKNVGPGLALVDGFSFPHQVSAPPLNVGDLNPSVGLAVGENGYVTGISPVNTPVNTAPSNHVSGYAGYASPATGPINTQDNTAPVATPVPTYEVLTPEQVVKQLLNKAASDSVSGAALNYANAAVAAATALQLLQDAAQ